MAACSEGMEAKDFVVEVDMIKYNNDPPIVVEPFKSLMECNGLPDWGCREDPAFRHALLERQENMTNEMLLFIHRGYDTDFGCCTMTLQTP